MNANTNDHKVDEPHVRARPIIVGVVLHQAAVVLQRAAELAVDLGTELVCANTDPSRFEVSENSNGSSLSLPFDSDVPELTQDEFDPVLFAHIDDSLRDSPVTWSTRILAGDPAHALSRLANSLDARLIVVGSREGVRSSIQEFFGGSVAVHLAHRQHRPVLVVPVAPTPHGAPLPWSDE